MDFLAEPGVAKVARRHLDADAVLSCHLFRLEMAHAQWHVLLSAQLLDESLVAVGLGAPQMEVAMQRLDLVAQLLHDEQQGRGVGTTTKGNEKFPNLPYLAVDVASDLMEYVIHFHRLQHRGERHSASLSNCRAFSIAASVTVLPLSMWASSVMRWSSSSWRMCVSVRCPSSSLYTK